MPRFQLQRSLPCAAFALHAVPRRVRAPHWGDEDWTSPEVPAKGCIMTRNRHYARRHFAMQQLLYRWDPLSDILAFA